METQKNTEQDYNIQLRQKHNEQYITFHFTN